MLKRSMVGTTVLTSTQRPDPETFFEDKVCLVHNGIIRLFIRFVLQDTFISVKSFSWRPVRDVGC